MTPAPRVSAGVAPWLLGCAGMVFGMVCLGGATRLTRSGLSMTDWKFFGRFPPTTEAEWELEFAKYKQFPEYIKLYGVDSLHGMDLDEFKKIFWFEYSHRMWGRAIGAAYALPLGYFALRGRLTAVPGLRSKLAGILGMIGGQGLLGWYMVKSGLSEETIVGDEPRVSQYRLVSHLMSAFAIYSAMVWTYLDVKKLPALTDRAVPVAHKLPPGMRVAAISAAGAVIVTVTSGGFLAGTRGGFHYNTFPKMADRWIPENLWTIEPAWKNAFENATMTQFNHRVLALSTFAGLTALNLFARKHRATLPRGLYRAIHALFGMSLVQVGLGISTLLMEVPVVLGTAHQAGALALHTFAVWLMHELKLAKRLPLKK